MKKENISTHVFPPKRKELSDNPVKLCSEISRLFHMQMRERCDLDGVMTQPGARLIMSFLAIEDGVKQRELVSRTHLRAPSVSAIIKRMANEGMVTLKTDEKDMRAMRVYLTDYGRQVDRERIQKIKQVDSIGLLDIDEDEQAYLMRLLTKIRDNLLYAKEECEKPQ